jgi:hypothetical protein
MLFLRGAQLVLMSSVLAVFGLAEEYVSLKYAEILGSVLSGDACSDGGRQSC